MQVPNGLAGIRAAIDHHAITLVQARLRRDLAGHQQQVPEQRGVGLRDVVERGDLFLGITSTWMGAWGWTLRKARQRSSS